MFDSVIVANRGEIAVRIIGTLRRLGIRSIAVYSDADRDARHTRDADVAVRIGPAAAAQSYLDIERVIDAASASGAQALHPGYGFLSENTALAAACAAAGIVFVGPPMSAIEAMGDKIRAKQTVAAHGVRVVPGVEGVGIGDDELAERALEIGFPMLIKPSAGGGGKGMRIVTAADGLAGAIAGAKREALGAFGDDTLLIERFVTRPRHIEVQVLADAHGHVVHLGERECSLQRRHQKVIEEAPSPFLSPADREALGAQAVAAATACGYVNAGTVEFIVSGQDPSDAFFMEMNTRLQVEHPVTEMVWGLDLVEQQLRIAAGEALSFSQHELQMRGHAFEARVYAEDAGRGFLPTGGTVLALHEPADLPDVRVDSSLLPGTEVGSDYDPMLSKVIAWGPDRDAARRRLDHALSATSVLGVTTNIGFLRTLLADPDVAAGRMDTSLAERIAAAPRPTRDDRTATLAAAFADLRPDAPSSDPWLDRAGWRLGEPAWSTWRATDGDGRPVEVRLRRASTGWHAKIHDDPAVAAWPVDIHNDPDRSRVRVDTHGESGAPVAFTIARAGGTTWLGAGGLTWTFSGIPPIASGTEAEPSGALTIASPMPGTVVTVLAHPDDTVVAGQAVVVVEAMKMEHTLRAPTDATVAEVLVAPGHTIALNQRLVVLETVEGAAETGHTTKETT